MSKILYAFIPLIIDSSSRNLFANLRSRIMENLSDMYYLFRLVISRIFVYLRDVILPEFYRFAEEIDDSDTTGKGRGHFFTRRAMADFVAFFTVCAFFGSFVVFSSNRKKVVETYEPPARPASPDSEGEHLELLDDDDDCTIISPPREGRRRNAWGDATSYENNVDTFTGRKTNPRNRPRIPASPEICRSSSSIFELRESHSQHSQSTQTNERILRRASKNRDWLIRRTRSGHAYGKYPM